MSTEPSTLETSATSVPTAASEQPMVQRCENCGAVVASQYCGDCGQRLEHSVYSVWHFLREATEDLTHADSRLWRTLGALLYRPGLLTRESLEGRRARYLPPVRLYNLDSNAPPSNAPSTSAAAPVQRQTGGRAGIGQHCDQLQYDGPWRSKLEPALRASCQKVAADRGRALREQLAHNLPRALFVFLPLLALFMKLMYWRPPRYYIEHLLFFLHNHSAAFLLLTVSWVRGSSPQE